MTKHFITRLQIGFSIIITILKCNSLKNLVSQEILKLKKNNNQ